MLKKSLYVKHRFLGNMMVIVQGLILILLTIAVVSQQYLNAWQAYPADDRATAIYLHDIPSDKEFQTEIGIKSVADKYSLFIIRRESMLDNEGSVRGFVLGVYGDARSNDIALSFYDQKVLSGGSFETLMNSDSADSTLGVEAGSVNSLGDIASFRFYERFVVKHLSQLIDDSGGINGAYYFIGVDADTKTEFLSDISAVSGLSENDLLTEKSGEIQVSGLMRKVPNVLLAADIFLNLIFFVVLAVRSLEKQGKLTLLGWSKAAFIREIFGVYFITSIIAVPILIIGGLIISGWGGFFAALLSFFAGAAALNLLLTLAEIAVASVVIIMTKPLDSIKGRIPKKPLYALTVLAYMIISVGFMVSGSAMDLPMKDLSENARLSKNWANVSNYQLMRSISLGQDESSFKGQSKQLDEDLYNWYSSVSQEDGVYLIQAQYYGSDILDIWAGGVYSSVPAAPYWRFTISPNYAEKIGIQLDPETISQAESGKRLYLIPDTLIGAERDTMIALIEEQDVMGIGAGDIQTKFTQDKEFLFIFYTPDKEFFTWAADSKGGTMAAAPIIYVATPENMRFFETGSLKASGLNGYIKFENESVMNKYAQADILSRFNLSDNAVAFTAVRVYIDGLQKDIMQTIVWFGAAFLVLIVILTAMLLTFATVFRVSNQEKINVKKFLGFSFFQLYRMPILFILCAVALEVVAMVLFRSKFGLLLVVLSSLIQGLIFRKYMSCCEIKQLLSAFKGE
ncbi:hypothetical protein LQZ18_01955 [Lachnospiraceae bacterium ZAX-1]